MKDSHYIIGLLIGAAVWLVISIMLWFSYFERVP